MSVAESARELEQRVKEAGGDMKAVLERAGIHRATFDRWKAGSNAPRLDRWQQLEAAARAVLAAVRSGAAPQEARP